ncbi:MAG: hypothetical protein II368_00115 [Clostridia bacterium]|jgi:hypothetical protein|nr:hypothetical protein [Clostridia bacterium]
MDYQGFSRLKKTIEADRKNGAEGGESLLRSDLVRLLSEYFVLSSGVEVAVTPERGYYVVTVRARAERIRPAHVLPEEGVALFDRRR